MQTQLSQHLPLVGKGEQGLLHPSSPRPQPQAQAISMA